MIINRSSFDRGFAAGSIYKCQFVDLREIATGRYISDHPVFVL